MNGTRLDGIADTSVIINWMRGDLGTTAAVNRHHFAITFVTLAELYLGALKSANPHVTLARIQRMLPEEKVFHSSARTPVLYAEICHDLERRGVRIPSNDIWIAALAIENDLPLLARDEHFTRVSGLTVVSC